MFHMYIMIYSVKNFIYFLRKFNTLNLDLKIFIIIFNCIIKIINSYVYRCIKYNAVQFPSKLKIVTK